MESKILFIVFISIFSVTAIITLAGITNLIKGIREKYLTPLFTALILEVIAAVILLFKNQDFSDKKTIPDILYQESSIQQSNSIDKDCYKFIELIKDGKKSDSLLKTKIKEIDLKIKEIDFLKLKVNELAVDTLKDFYYYIQQLEKLRLSSHGIINLKSSNITTANTLKILEQILFLNGRLSKDSNSKNEIIAAFKKFKLDNHRKNKTYKVYLQDVPLFVKEYLEENYELEFYISNPNIPASITSKLNKDSTIKAK